MMNRLFKLISLVLTISVVAMSFSFCLTASASQDVFDAKSEFGFLKAVGIIDDEAFVPEQIVTRAQFVKYAIGAIGLNPTAVSSNGVERKSIPTFLASSRSSFCHSQGV